MAKIISTGGLKKDQKVENSEKSGQNLASLSFSLILLIIGIPIWWKTTEVYRVDLPYDKIEALNSTKILLPIPINLLYVEEIDKNMVEKLAENLSEILNQKFIHEKLNLSYKFLTQKMSPKNKKLLEISTTIEKFDENLEEIDKNLHILILPDNFSFKNSNFCLHFGSKMTFFIQKSSKNCQNLNSIIEKILTEIYIFSSKFNEISRKHFDKRLITRKKRSIDREKSHDQRKIDKFLQPNLFPEYTIEFSIIVPDPDGLNFYAGGSNFDPQLENGSNLHFYPKKFFDDDFQPFANRLKNLTTLKFTSQFLFFVDFDVKPHLHKSKNGKNEKLDYYFYSHKDLPHLISHLETYTTVFESDRKTLRFLIYVTPKSKRPLFIHNEKGEKLEAENGFLVTSWGGIVIFNQENQNLTEFSLNSRIQNVLFSQLRVLMGFNVQKSHVTLPEGHVTWSKNPVSDWQLKSLAYESILDYCFGSMATLNSLTKLLAEITNIVINDEVGLAINQAVLNTENALRLLVDGSDDVIDSYRLAKMARDQSERAFFDQSLLALLYFPEDQKYAIYVPLFLPVGLPIVLSIFPTLKLIKQWRLAKKSIKK